MKVILGSGIVEWLAQNLQQAIDDGEVSDTAWEGKEWELIMALIELYRNHNEFVLSSVENKDLENDNNKQ